MSKLDDSSLSAYDILSANLNFVIEFVKRLKPDPSKGPRKVALTLPDSAERQRAAKYFGDDEPWTGTRLWSLNGGDEKAEEFSPMALFGSLFKRVAARSSQPSGRTCTSSSARRARAARDPAPLRARAQRPDRLLQSQARQLRGDLGLPAFLRRRSTTSSSAK